MALSELEGYNIATKINGKTVVGLTQDDLSVSPVIKESITKADAGNKRRKVTGHDVTISMTANLCVGTAGANEFGRDDLLAQSLKKGDEAEIPVLYACEGGANYSGTAVMSSYSESTNSEDIGQVTIELTISGDFTLTT